MRTERGVQPVDRLGTVLGPGPCGDAQQAQTDSAYLRAGTLLVNRENEKLLALINSGRTIFPYVGVNQAPMLNANFGVFRGQKAAGDGGCE